MSLAFFRSEWLALGGEARVTTSNDRFSSLSGEGVANYYDALGRLSSTGYSMGGTTRYVSYGYDAAGRTTVVEHPDGKRFPTPMTHWAASPRSRSRTSPAATTI